MGRSPLTRPSALDGRPRQQTRLQLVLDQLGRNLKAQIGTRWATASAALLALLAGIFLGENLSAILLWKLTGGRPILVLGMVVIYEVLVRLRSRVVSDVPPLGWVVIDNLRIGVVFALVLEAFKLGS
ncbi:MAG: DUF565 domain-containing protein [Cyanobacteriota bacterium]|nr:DUF565 domain-containing protein [Cyanobacteriota bacterium]